jgi:hypothetical protein
LGARGAPIAPAGLWKIEPICQEEPIVKTRLIWTLCALLLCAVAAPARGEEDDQKASYWMKKKLEYSGQILSGLTSNDFDKIAKSARSMNALGHLERWVPANSSDYREQFRIFQSANRQLVEMADDENLDGAALAYVQLTLSCVN